MIARQLLIALTLAMSCTFAEAATLTFNEFADDDTNTFNSLVTSGFRVRGGDDGITVWGRNHAYQADPGFATIASNYPDTVMRLSLLNKQSFDFLSIDIADTFDNSPLAPSGSASNSILFTFNRTGSATTQVVTLDTTPGLQTFTFNQVGVKSVTWQQGADTIGEVWVGQFDNVNVSAAVAAVPEPSTYALMLVGLGLVGYIARVRRRQRFDRHI